MRTRHRKGKRDSDREREKIVTEVQKCTQTN